ncbi:hypothetical protein DL98DRAFT_212944 [Cadophora sp. DSE1049]|nr:hypothetical protein DL98DRAFT_212944 [Cadophora sp. DSE1049]
MHLSRLERIVQLRGGWNTFDNNETLRCQLFGVDLAGACRRDSRARFPMMPEALIQEAHSTNHSPSIGAYGISPFLASCMNLYIQDPLLLKAFHDLSIAINYVNRKSRRGEQWVNIKFFVFWIDAIVHGLVEQEFLDKSNVLQEFTRLGVLLFLLKIRRYCGQLGVSMGCSNAKLRSFVSRQRLLGFAVSTEKILLWALFMGLLESREKSDQDCYIKMMTEIAYEIGFWSWAETLAAAKKVVWIQDAFDAEVKCRDRFEVVLNGLIIWHLSKTHNED